MLLGFGTFGTAAAPERYRLVWADEFNGRGAPDPKNWRFEHGFVRNRKLEWYQPENATVKSGRLVIEAKKQQVENPDYEPGSSDWRKSRRFADYTSACVETRGLHEWLYGRIEVRAKISAKPGLWPAIWTLGVSKPWPSNGEVDVLEFYRDTILANTAYGVDGGTWHTVRTPYANIARGDSHWDDRFHTWRMDWDENWIRIFLDGRLLNETDISHTTNPDGFNPFHQPHSLLLNLAIGSTGGDPSATRFPSRYEIDYVRVYQKADAR